jgi:tetratricopeptide (TPR) repeat protein
VIAKVADTGNRELADAALRLTAVLERTHPGQAKPLAASADLLFHSGRKDEALEKYRATLALDKSVFAVWDQLLLLRHARGEMAELYREANQALDLFPNKTTLYYSVALAAESMRRPQEALDNLDQALLMVGRDDQLKAELHALLGQVHTELGDLDAAEAAFAEARRLRPQSAEINYRYAFLLQAKGQTRDARAQAEAAVKAQPDNFYYLEMLARIQFRQSDYEQARQTLDKAMPLGAERWMKALELYGDVLYQLKDAEGAVGYWNRARERGGDWPNLLKKISNRQWYE